MPTSSYPDGGYRNHMRVTNSSCYKLLISHTLLPKPHALLPLHNTPSTLPTFFLLRASTPSVAVALLHTLLHHHHSLACSMYPHPLPRASTPICCWRGNITSLKSLLPHPPPHLQNAIREVEDDGTPCPEPCSEVW